MKRLTIKKIPVFVTAVLAAVCLAACGGSSASTEAASSAETKTVIDITTAAETAPSETASAAPTAAPAGTEGGSSELTAQPFEESDLVLVVDGVELSLGMDFVPAVGKIMGGVYDEQTGQACVGGGNDRNYFYGGGTLSIYTVGGANGEQLVYDIFINGLEGYATRKGAVIGKTTRAEVLALYGEPAASLAAAEKYSLDAFDLIFGFDGEILASVGLHDNGVR